jgi:hypothetical protein
MERPDLRIVDDRLWREVQARLQAKKKAYVRDTKGGTAPAASTFGGR